MIITKHYKTGDDYLTLHVECPPLPDKIITIYLDAVMDGKVSVEQQIQLAEADAEKRLQKHLLAESIINDTGN